MPELPEVESRVRYLRATCLHKEIVRIRVTDSRLVKDTSVPKFCRKVRGSSFESANRKGKFILLELERSGFLIMHLGMTGDVKYYKRDAPPYARITFAFHNGFSLAYLSRRMLQGVWLKDDPAEHKLIKQMGPDPLAPDLTSRYFIEKLNSRSISIKIMLMDQTFIAGIGNIYSDEILFQCGISPLRKASRLKGAELEKIFHETRRVMHEVCAVKADWTRLTDGYLLKQRLAGGSCPRCGEELRRIKIGGRSSYFCPRCQK